MNPILYALPGNEELRDGLAAQWPADHGALEVHRFPDGESLVRFADAPAGRDVVLICTLRDPDTRLWPLLVAADTARDLGARSVGLVAPYLAYMRQDQQFAPGQAITAKHFARVLSAHLDWLTTVDPHLHRVHTLDEIYSIPTAVVAAAPLLARWIEANVERPVLIGPDAESRQWVSRVADLAQAPWLILEKTRLSDQRVELTVPDVARWKKSTPVIVDDIISSGGTLVETIHQLREQGLRRPVCVAVHAVFAQWAYWALLEAGAAQIVTTNTIAHDSNAIDIGAAVAETSRALLARLPLRGAASARAVAVA